jgi:hypothetical protein
MSSTPFNPTPGEVIPPERTSHPAVVRGFAQSFGLHGSVAAFVIAVDLMVNAAGLATLEAGLIPLSIGAGVVMGLVTYLAQRRWFGDDEQSALIKALMMGVLTCIPTSIPNCVLLPAAAIGFFRRKKV